jgi:hypothetical protein
METFMVDISFWSFEPKFIQDIQGLRLPSGSDFAENQRPEKIRDTQRLDHPHVFEIYISYT